MLYLNAYWDNIYVPFWYKGEQMKKKYMCWWSSTFTSDGVALKDEDYFTEMKEYSLEEIRDIKNLNIGDTWISPGYNTDHIITCVEDIE